MSVPHVLICILPLLLTLPIFADTLHFKSGNRLTGKITSILAGSMTFESEDVGTVTIPLNKLDTFTTDEAVSIELKSGEVVKQKFHDNAGIGFIAYQSDPAAKPTKIALSDINDAPKKNKPKWTGSVGGYLRISRGNTHGEAFNTTFTASKRRENDRFSSNGAYYYDRQNHSTTTHRWLANGQYDFFFSKKMYSYGKARYEHDEIARLEHRISPGLGVGYQWIENPTWNVLTEVGINYVYEDYDYIDPSHYVAGRFAYHITRSFTDTLSGFHNFEWIPEIDSTNSNRINADAGVQAKLSSRWALNAKVELEYYSHPADGIYHSDLRYIFGALRTF